MPLTAGIIGCGGIAQSHVDAYLKAGVSVIAFSDPCKEAAETLSESVDGSQVYDDFKTLIDSAHPDIISICSPPVAHEEAAVYALGKNINVLCEKPMAFDIPAAYRMREAVQKSSALFMPAFRHRFLPANVAIRKVLTSGTIGDVVFFNNVFGGSAFEMEGKWFTKRAIAGGGTLMDTSSHSVDLFRFLVGEIVDQKAVMHTHFKTTDVEDAAILTVRSEGGALGNIQSSFVMGEGQAYIDIIGTKGRLYYDYYDSTKVKYRLTDEPEWTVIEVEASMGFDEEISHLIGAIRGEHPLALTVDDGVRVMEVIQSVY